MFVLQIPFDVDVTPTSATLPTTKFVIGHLDTLPGYGYNTYADLPLTPFGVYSENWSNTPISELQNVRFSDSYGENPAYQSIMNLYIDNTLDISVSGVTSKLKYETFAVSGTIPLLESIVTTESLIVKPEIPIQLTLNDVGVSMSTVMDRELPVYVTLSDLDTYQEYVVTVSPSPSVLDVSVVASSILPQKFTSAQNVISLYQLRLADTIIADVTDQTFESIIPQSLYESGNTSFGQTAFDGFIKNYPNSYQQYNKIITPYVVNTESNYAGQSTVVSYTASGFKYRIYAELSLSELASTTIGELSEYNLELYADTVTDITVKASPSPFIDGHASLPAPQDIFRSKYSREINSTANSLITTNNFITVYNKISGTISSGTSSYSNTTISEYGNTSISLVQSKSFGGTLSTVLGIDTDLVSDFSSGDTLLANNELFTVEAIANATFMTTTTAPTTAYSGVIAYNIPT